MSWRTNGARQRKRQARLGADAGSTPVVRVVAPTGVAQQGEPTVQRSALGERPHSRRWPIPKSMYLVYDDTPYAPLSMHVQWVRK